MTENPQSNILSALDELLRDPDRMIGRQGTAFPWRLLIGAALGITIYGAVAGTFQGGSQILVAALKAPLIVFASTLLCLPSYFVFVTLAGSRCPPLHLATYMTGFLGIVSLLLVALLPIAWLFSISTRSLGFMGFLHLSAFLFSLLFGVRFLVRCHPSEGGRSGLLPWILLLTLVSVQVASQLRPVLYRPAATPLFAPEREFFLKHWHDTIDEKPVLDTPRIGPESED